MMTPTLTNLINLFIELRRIRSGFFPQYYLVKQYPVDVITELFFISMLLVLFLIIPSGK